VTEQVEAEQQALEKQESEAGFGAGFAKVRGYEPPAEVKAEVKAETKPEEKAEADGAEKAATDAEKAAEAKDPVQQALSEINAKLGALDKIEHRLKSAEGRIGAMQEGAKAAKAAVNAGHEAPSQAQIETAAKSGEKWEAIKKDFPEWAAAMDERLAAIAAKPQQSSIDVEAMRRDLVDETEKRMVLTVKHPDWRTAIKAPEFKSWLIEGGPTAEEFDQQKQLERTEPQKAEQMVQSFARQYPEWWVARGAKLFSDSIENDIQLLDAFKARASAPETKGKQEKTRRLERATTPNGVPATGPAVLPDDAGFSRGFAKARGS
jgi:hypothetical protein